MKIHKIPLFPVYRYIKIPPPLIPSKMVELELPQVPNYYNSPSAPQEKKSERVMIVDLFGDEKNLK